MISSTSLKELNDYYLYYDPPDEETRVGVIRAVTANMLAELDGTPYIRIPASFGMDLVSGEASSSDWMVVLNEKTQKMELIETTNYLPKNYPFSSIPKKQKNPEIVVTWDGTSFAVTAPGVEYAVSDAKLDFYVTEVDDPHIMYQHFDCRLINAIRGDAIVGGENVPISFSVFTKQIYDRYQLVTVR